MAHSTTKTLWAAVHPQTPPASNTSLTSEKRDQFTTARLARSLARWGILFRVLAARAQPRHTYGWVRHSPRNCYRHLRSTKQHNTVLRSFSRQLKRMHIKTYSVVQVHRCFGTALYKYTDVSEESVPTVRSSSQQGDTLNILLRHLTKLWCCGLRPSQRLARTSKEIGGA
jgi:hypothetical protein